MFDLNFINIIVIYTSIQQNILSGVPCMDIMWRKETCESQGA